MIDGRRSAIFLLVVGLGLALTVAAFVHAHRERARAADGLAATRALVEAYDLTDPALFTEARYTRHPSVADRHSAFQDGPLSPEHFPSGALVSPPARLRLSMPQLPPLGLRGEAGGERREAEGGQRAGVRSQESAGRATEPQRSEPQSRSGEKPEVRSQRSEASSPGFDPEPATGNRQLVTRRLPPLTTHHSPLAVSHEGDVP